RSGCWKESLVLALGHPHDEAVEVVGDLDLAGEARVVLDVFGEVEHRLLHRRLAAGLVDPGLVHIDVTGGAGAGAAAVGVDAGDVVLHGAVHHRQTRLHIHDVLGAVELDVGDLGHIFPDAVQAATSFMETAGSASLARSIGFCEPINCRAAMNSAGALTASTARMTEPFRWKTANLAAAGSPRSRVSSASNGTPASWSLTSYWSDQFQVTSCGGGARPAIAAAACLACSSALATLSSRCMRSYIGIGRWVTSPIA